MSTIEQSRHLATAIPGPKSSGAHRHARPPPSPRGIGNTMPVYAARAGGGIVEDVDGNRLIDLGSGIAVTTIGNASPRVVEAVAAQVAEFTHTCFMVTPVRGVRRGVRAAQPADPGRGRDALGAVQLGFRGRRERHQDRPHLHAQAGRRRVRPRLPRPHQPHDGADREVDALQARLRPVRARDLPRADVLPVPRRRVRQGARHRRRTGRQAGDQRHRQAGRRRQPGRGHHRADPGRGRLHRSRRGLPARRCSTGAGRTTWSSSPTRCRPVSPAPVRCSPASTTASSPTSSSPPRASPTGCRWRR